MSQATTAEKPPETEVEEVAPARLNGDSPPVAVDFYAEPEEPREQIGQPRLFRYEGLVVALLFGIAYGVIGYFALTDARIVNFDALQRLSDAYTVWWNDPPRLAAISLGGPPLGSLAFLPLALIKPLATSLVALPVQSAVAAGLMMAAVNSLLRRCDLSAGIRYPLLLLFGLNPMLVFYAGNGDQKMTGMLLVAIALTSAVSWRISNETRFLIGAGLALGCATLFEYGYALWAVGFVMLIMFVSSEQKNSALRHRSALLVFMLPGFYAIMAWSLLNLVLVGNAFQWIGPETDLIQVNTTGVLVDIPASFGSAIGDFAEVTLAVAPLGFASILLLLASAIFGGNGLSRGLLAVSLFAVAVPMAIVLTADQANLMQLAIGLPIALLALAGAAWVYASQPGWRIGVLIVMFIGLIAALPLTWSGMKDYEFQDQAQAYVRWIEGDGSQEGTKSVGGYTVGIDPELAMASYINGSLPDKKNSILVDENYNYGPILLTGKPDLFFNRPDKGEGVWSQRVENPYGKVDYMLVNYSRPGDQLTKQYPDLVTGGEFGLTPIFRTARYVLIQVSETRPPREADKVPGQIVPQSEPQPFTPVTPARSPAPGSQTPSTPGLLAPESQFPPQGQSSTGGGAGTGGTTGATGQSSAPLLEGE